MEFILLIIIVFVVFATLIMFQNNIENYQHGGALKDDINNLENVVTQLNTIKSEILEGLSLNNDKTFLTTLKSDISNIGSNLTKNIASLTDYVTSGLKFK